MRRINTEQDIRPLSEFRANSASFIQQIQETRRPLVLTQRGHSAAVLLDVREYEGLLEELESLREIHQAEQQLAQGQGIAHEDAKKQILAGLGK